MDATFPPASFSKQQQQHQGNAQRPHHPEASRGEPMPAPLMPPPPSTLYTAAATQEPASHPDTALPLTEPRPSVRLSLRRGHFPSHHIRFVPPDLPKKLHRTHQTLFEDIVFDEARWEKHRSSWHRHKIELVIFLRVALGFFWQILLVMLISVGVGLYETFLVPIGAPSASTSLSTVFNMLTFALSLLLVFKTNSSFARWWEGRIIWGQVVNCTRNYARMLLQYAPESQQDLCHLGVTWTIAAPHVLRGYIRQLGPDAIKEAAHILTEEELKYLAQWRNPPAGVARVMSWVASELKIHPERQRQLEEQVNLYVNNAGACERIYKTPIPAAYTRHTSRFLMIFLSISPILLWQAAKWTTPVIVGLVAFLLLGTENIGVQIEEPFRVLPLDAISKGIENNLKEMEADHMQGTSHLEALRAASGLRVSS